MNNLLVLCLFAIITTFAILSVANGLNPSHPALSKRNSGSSGRQGLNNINFQFNVNNNGDTSRNRNHPYGPGESGAEVGGGGEAEPSPSTTTTTTTVVVVVEETKYIADDDVAGMTDSSGPPGAPDAAEEGALGAEVGTTDGSRPVVPVGPEDIEGTADTADAADSVDGASVAEAPETMNRAGTIDAADTVGAADAADAADSIDGGNLADTVGQADTIDTTDLGDAADTADTMDAADTDDTIDVADTGDIADTVDAADIADAADTVDSTNLEEEDVNITDQAPPSPETDPSARIPKPILRSSLRNKALQRARKPNARYELDMHYKKFHTTRLALQDTMCTMCFYLIPTAAEPMLDHEESRVRVALGSRYEWVKYRDVKNNLLNMVESAFQQERAVPEDNWEDVCSSIVSREVTLRTKKYTSNVKALAKDVQKASRNQKTSRNQKDRAEAYESYVRDMKAGNIEFDCKKDYTQAVTDLQNILG